MLLHEYTVHGLNIEFSKPSGARADGSIDQWSDRILLPSMRLDGDFSIFESGSEPDEFDFPVDPK